jgi:homoserine O-succinyltransferase
MPVYLNAGASSRDSSVVESSDTCINIGLINNMPDGALRATERQFVNLLGSAAKGIVVRLSLYFLPEVSRTEAGLSHLNHGYSSVNDLWNSSLDGLIVTGAEPRAPELTDEPYWRSLTRVLDWAENNTSSTIWSCLAAHAALLHTGGIRRRRLVDKRFGVFGCTRTSDHPLTAGGPAVVRMPHSRWNDIPENELADCGYRVLLSSPEAGVDTFVRQGKSLFVFFQGHPEYEANTLLLEYRRDIERFLRRERDTYPLLPSGYFNPASAEILTALRERTLCDPQGELFADFPVGLAETGISNTWHPMAARVYGNWLTFLCSQKARRLKDRQRWKHPHTAEIEELPDRRMGL